MPWLDSMLLIVANGLSEENYLFLTKVQGFFWNIADFLITFFMLKVADQLRMRLGRERITARFFLLYITALVTPLLFFSDSPVRFISFTLFICGTQFFILASVLVFERRLIVDFIRAAARGRAEDLP